VTKRKSKKRQTHPRRAWPILAMVAVVLLGGLGLRLIWRPNSSAETSLEATDVASTFPAWLANAPSKAQRSYAQAVKHRDELGYVRCYCGCEKIGHLSVADCYVAQVAADGRITYDRHGIG
jgi:hypothetical protein